MKKKFALLLAFTMLLSLLPTNAFAQVPWFMGHRTGMLWESQGPATNVRHWTPGVLVGRPQYVAEVAADPLNVDSQGRTFATAPGGNLRHIVAGAEYFALLPNVPIASIRMEIHNVDSWLGRLSSGPDVAFDYPGSGSTDLESWFLSNFNWYSETTTTTQAALMTQMHNVFYDASGDPREIAFMQWTEATSPQLGVALVLETDTIAHLVLMRQGAGWETWSDARAAIPVPIEYVTSGDTNDYPVFLTFQERSGWPQAGDSGRRTYLTANQPSRFTFSLDGSPRSFHRYGRSELRPLRIAEAVQGSFDQRRWHVDLNITSPGFFWTSASTENIEFSTRFEGSENEFTIGEPRLLSPVTRTPVSGNNRFRTLSFALDLPGALNPNRFVNDWLEITGLSVAADDRARVGDVEVEIVLSRTEQAFPASGGAWWGWRWDFEPTPVAGDVLNAAPWQFVDQEIAAAGESIRIYRTGTDVLTRNSVGNTYVGTFNANLNQPITTGVWERRAEVYDGTLTVARYGMIGLELELHANDDANDHWLRSGMREWGFDLTETGVGRRPIGAVNASSIDPDIHKTARAVLRETVPGSLPATGAHPTTFTFDEGIQVLGVRLWTNNANFSAGHNDTDDEIWFGSVHMDSDNFLNASISRNTVTIRPEIGETVSRRDRIAQITAEFYLSVMPGFEHLRGDEIKVTVNSGTIEDPFEDSVTVAYAWDPITVETDVKVIDEVQEAAFGMVRGAAINDIVITETEAGALMPGTRLWIGVEGGISRGWGVADSVSIGAREARVVGDSQMQVSRPRQDSHGTYVEILRASRSDNAQIVFSGVEISGRVLPSHEYSIIVADSAVADNWNEFVWLREDLGAGSTRGIVHGFFAEEPYATPAFRFEGADLFHGPPRAPEAPPLVNMPGRTVTLFEGMNHRTTDGYQLNAPLFLLIPNADNQEFSTSYVMMRVVADILGLQWTFDPASQTATFTDGTTEVTFTHNSSTAMVNGSPMEIRASGLRADARIINERFFVPIAFFRYVFNADVSWNGASRSVTVTAR